MLIGKAFVATAFGHAWPTGGGADRAGTAPNQVASDGLEEQSATRRLDAGPDGSQ
jgi:hypothetical protein